MRNDIDSSERFVAQLRELKPAQPGRDLQLRLEGALRDSKLQSRSPQFPSNVVHHPFFQWSAAAAALLTALFLSIESTEHRLGTALSQTLPDSSPAAPQRVFHLVEGKLIPTSGRSAMLQTSYQGIEVFEGKAYRKFGRGQESFLELIEIAPKAE